MSDKTIKALKILSASKITALDFAKGMWPMSDYWHKPYKNGRGSKMVCSAAGYLGKLVGSGFVKKEDKKGESLYSLTTEGKKLVRSNTNSN